MEPEIVPIVAKISEPELTLPFDQIPNQSQLFLDFQYKRENAAKFYPGSSKPIEEIAESVLENYHVDRNALCDLLRDTHIRMEAGSATMDNIERLRGEKCVAVISGQQAGLFSGPLFTIYKAISAIKLARELSEKGIEAVPLFWIASEDHDIEEANRVYVADQDSELFEIVDEISITNENTPVSYIKLGEKIKDSIEEYFSCLPQTDFSEEVLLKLKEFYRSENSFSSGFARYLLEIFAKYGLVLVCPMSGSLRKLVSPIIAEAVERHEEITAELLGRDNELAENRYHSQVFVTEEFFPFFYISESKQRIALRYDKTKDLIHSIQSDITFTKSELVEIAKSSPDRLSPNVLMRSVVQDYLFPTVCYFGGSAEIAYFAQNEVIYRLLDRPHTQFRHRASFTVVDPKSARNLRRYDLGLEDMFISEDELMAKIIDKYIANDTARIFEETELKLVEQLNALERSLIRSDLTLAENLENRKRKILWHLHALKNRFHRSEAFKNEVVAKRLRHSRINLFPRNALQERTFNIVYYLNEYGDNFVDWVYQAADMNEKDHQIFYL